MTPSDASAVHIRSVVQGAELDQIRTLLREYNAHLFTFMDPGLLRHRVIELDRLPAEFVPPLGALLLATSEGHALGCAALRPIPLPEEPSAAEFCRLWVTPSARGRSLGQRLLGTAITHARAAGHTALYLNSARGTMTAAQSIYARAGFVPIPPYKPIGIENIEFFRLDLKQADPARL